MRAISGFAVRCSIILAAMSLPASAEKIIVATGEYPPFVGQKERSYGVTAAIVKAAFARQGVDVDFEFLPWKRGYIETERAVYVATFPYVKNPEREAEFFYSEPFYIDKIRLFARKESAKMTDWNGKSICVPIGYDVSYLHALTTRYKLALERPPEMKFCYMMLNTLRVDAIWSSEQVGFRLLKELFGDADSIRPLDSEVSKDVDYYLIVSRKHPEAHVWLQKFNRGLQQMRKDGSYRKLLAEF